ncbi:MAG TPA: Rrf2 family transcriptional regulator [Gemmatimonadales bacterium]|nr:Rrf2 family transcriptional regulator [Gemmatimonadales bacterium]
MLSQTAEYALRAVLYLAQEATERPVRVEEMARALRLPRNYLSKTLHLLSRAGVLVSARGKGGGFQLAVPPERLPLLRVVSLFDRFDDRRRCLLGRPQCSDRTACAAHTRWKEVAETVTAFFRQTSVADLLKGATLPV